MIARQVSRPMKSASVERAHRLVGAELHRGVDDLDGADALVERVDRLVDHRHQDAVDDEGREVLGRGRGLAHLLARRRAWPVGRLVGGDAADQLHELHHRHRVHEVHAHELLRPVGAGGEAGDRDRRGVRGEDRVRREVRDERLEDPVLERSRSVAASITRSALAEGGELGRATMRASAASRSPAVTLPRATWRSMLPSMISRRLGERLLRDVLEHHVEARERGDCAMPLPIWPAPITPTRLMSMWSPPVQPRRRHHRQGPGSAQGRAARVPRRSRRGPAGIRRRGGRLRQPAGVVLEREGEELVAGRLRIDPIPQDRAAIRASGQATSKRNGSARTTTG